MKQRVAASGVCQPHVHAGRCAAQYGEYMLFHASLRGAPESSSPRAIEGQLAQLGRAGCGKHLTDPYNTDPNTTDPYKNSGHGALTTLQCIQTFASTNKCRSFGYSLGCRLQKCAGWGTWRGKMERSRTSLLRSSAMPCASRMAGIVASTSSLPSTTWSSAYVPNMHFVLHSYMIRSSSHISRFGWLVADLAGHYAHHHKDEYNARPLPCPPPGEGRERGLQGMRVESLRARIFSTRMPQNSSATAHFTSLPLKSSAWRPKEYAWLDQTK